MAKEKEEKKVDEAARKGKGGKGEKPAGEGGGKKKAEVHEVGVTPRLLLHYRKEVVTYLMKHPKLWKDIPIIPAYNTVEEFNRLEAYGSEGGGFTNEGDLPETERASKETVSLPIFHSMTEEEQEYIVRSVVEFYG